MKTFSFFVVARNSGQTIENLFDDLKAQSYPHDRIEVLLVDGLSNDNTKALMETFAKDNDFSRILVLDNPGQTLPAGWNVALRECKNEIIVRVDAHARIPVDFLEKIEIDFQAGEHIVGGPCNSIMQEDSPWQRTLLFTETSMFGGGIAVFRRAGQKGYVSSVGQGAYGREVFETVGGYDERLTRTEDNDMHYRMRKAGFQFLFDPEIQTTRYNRSSLQRMVKQKYANGYWIGLTMGIQPRCFELYHFVPLLFVKALIVTAILACFGLWIPLAVLGAAYGLANISMTVLSLPGKGFALPYLLLPLLFLLLHISYGIGTLIGIIGAPFYRIKHPTCKQIEQVREQMIRNDGENV